MTIDIDAIRARAERVRERLAAAPRTNLEAHTLACEVPELLTRINEQAAEIQRLRAVAEVAQRVIEASNLHHDEVDDLETVQHEAHAALIEAMRALPAVAGQPHYHDPIECGCELTAADAPKVRHAAEVTYDRATGSYGWSCPCGGGSTGSLPKHAAKSIVESHSGDAR